MLTTQLQHQPPPLPPTIHHHYYYYYYYYYALLTTPKSGGDGGGNIEVSFLVRLLVYVLLLGFSAIVLYLILKYLGVSNGDDDWSNNPMPNNAVQDAYRTSSVVVQTETEPLMRHIEPNEEVDEESGASSGSSEELYDEKLCVICYDEQRNSFFVPCGHCATCYDCAERIVNVEGKLCPICRRLIHKVRRLFHS